MNLEPEKMVEELRIALQVEMPEDLETTEDKWMYLLGRPPVMRSRENRRG